MNTINRILIGLRLIAAFILFQTLYFKFSGHPESVYIFSSVGMEPWGRIGTGILELIAGALLIFPGKQFWGAILGASLMGGAIVSHVFVLGIEIMSDGGLLFSYACFVFFTCLFQLFILRRKLADLTTRVVGTFVQ